MRSFFVVCFICSVAYVFIAVDVDKHPGTSSVYSPVDAVNNTTNKLRCKGK